MTLSSEFWSWMSPSQLSTAQVPTVGSRAPSTAHLQFPTPDGKPVVMTFLRHCGCPFAEKTFLDIHRAAASHPNIDFIAISHSDERSTQRWLASLPEESQVVRPNLRVIVDAERKSYAAWGLGIASFWHVLGSLRSTRELGKQGFHVRPTESGNRWQTAGSFAIDSGGIVLWSQEAQRADDLPSFENGVNSVSDAPSTKDDMEERTQGQNS